MVVVSWIENIVGFIASLVHTIEAWSVQHDGATFFNFASVLIALVLIEVMLRVVFPKNR